LKRIHPGRSITTTKTAVEEKFSKAVQLSGPTLLDPDLPGLFSPPRADRYAFSSGTIQGS
jgi:hypothetical protein